MTEPVFHPLRQAPGTDDDEATPRPEVNPDDGQSAGNRDEDDISVFSVGEHDNGAGPDDADLDDADLDDAGLDDAGATTTGVPVGAGETGAYPAVVVTDSPSPADDAERPSAPVQAGPNGSDDAGALAASGRPHDDDDNPPLAAGTGQLQAGWQRIKAGFVDNPRGSVAEAAGLVDEAAEMLVAALHERQQQIRDGWDDSPARDDTEALRHALLRYQSLFDRISGG
jgi:hypothetical protein